MDFFGYSWSFSYRECSVVYEFIWPYKFLRSSFINFSNWLTLSKIVLFPIWNIVVLCSSLFLFLFSITREKAFHKHFNISLLTFIIFSYVHYLHFHPCAGILTVVIAWGRLHTKSIQMFSKGRGRLPSSPNNNLQCQLLGWPSEEWRAQKSRIFMSILVNCLTK